MKDTLSKKYKLKKDKFTKARGGSSKFLIINCAQCGHPALLYQKDGPGGLLRMYLDKIHAPEDLVSLVSIIALKSEMSGLHCSNCDQLLAVPMLYVPESRLAFKLIRGTTQSNKSDGWFPPPEKIQEDRDQEGDKETEQEGDE